MTTVPRPFRGLGIRTSVALGGGSLAGLMAVAHVANDAMTSMLSGLLPTIQARFGLSEAVLAALVATLAFSSSVTQPLFGALSDRFGARRVAAAGTAFGVSMMSLMPVAPGPAVLFGLLLVGGLGSAAFHPAGTSLVASVGLSRRELGIGLFSAGGTLGLALGPLLVLVAAATLGVGFTPWLVLPAMALGLAMYALAPEQADTSRAGPPPILDRRLLGGPVAWLSLAATLSSIAFVSFSAGYPLFLVAGGAVSPGDPVLGVVLTVFNGAAALGAVLAAAGARRVRPGVLVPVTIAASVAPLGVLLVAPFSAFSLALVALAGALLNAGLPAMLVRAHDLAPDRRAAATGMLMGLPVGLAGLAYVGIGWLQGTIGIAPALGAAFTFALPAAAVAAVAMRQASADPRPVSRRPTDVVVGGCSCPAGA